MATASAIPVHDGCTGFFDTWRGINLLDCCNVHDLKWAENMTITEWVNSNVDLAVCFWNIGAWELAVPAFVATMTVGGVLYWVLRKKWSNK